MILILTNTDDATADYLSSILVANSIDYLRIDTDISLPQIKIEYTLAGPQLHVNGKWYKPECFSHVWYRRPTQLQHPQIDSSPEGKFILEEWAESFEGYLSHISDEKWVNHPNRNARASHKLEQLSRARSFGLTVPDTLVTQEQHLFRDFYARHQGQIITKPLATGHVHRVDGQKDSLIYTNQVLPEHLMNLSDLSICPTMFQCLVKKECDVRITFVGNIFHAIGLTALEQNGSQRCDIRRNSMRDVKYRPSMIPDDVLLKLKSLIASYGLKFAAIDMAITPEGEWVFFEVNPNGQWAWLDLDGVASIASSFVALFCP